MASDHAIVVDGAPDALADGAIAAAIADVRRIEAKYSRYRDDSVTAAVNRAAGGAPVAIDAETAALLAYADQCHRLSGGRFDVTSGVLRRAWDFRRSPPCLPDGCHARRAVRAGRLAGGRVGRAVHPAAAFRHGDRLRRHRQGVRGGSRRGDPRGARSRPRPRQPGRRRARARRTGRRDALACRCAAPACDRQPARPSRRSRSRTARWRRRATTSGTSRSTAAAIATCSIRAPGWPVRAWQSISVVAPLAVVAGSVATIAMLLADDAPDFLASQGLPWLGVDAAGEVRGTLGK